METLNLKFLKGFLKKYQIILTITLFVLSILFISFFSYHSSAQYSGFPSFGFPQNTIIDTLGQYNCEGFIDQFYGLGMDESNDPVIPSNTNCTDDGNCQEPPGYSILCAFDTYQDYADYLVEDFLSIDYNPVVSNANFQPEFQTYYFLPLKFQSENPLDEFQSEYGIPIFDIPGEQNGWTISGDQELIGYPLLPGLQIIGKVISAGFRWTIRHSDDVAKAAVKHIDDAVRAAARQAAKVSARKFSNLAIRSLTENIAQVTLCDALALATHAAVFSACLEGISTTVPNAYKNLANQCHDKAKAAKAAVFQICND